MVNEVPTEETFKMLNVAFEITGAKIILLGMDTATRLKNGQTITYGIEKIEIERAG